jgi:hypothetical protein
MSKKERDELMALDAMLAEGIRDMRNHIRSDLRRLRNAKARRADVRKQLEAL